MIIARQYDFAINATGKAEEVYRAIKVEPADKSEVGYLRNVIKGFRNGLLSKRTEIESRKEENRKQYSEVRAGELNKELDDSFSETVEQVQNVLIDYTNKLMDAKRKAVQEFTMTPIPEKSIQMINSYRLRDLEKVSDLEWNYLLSNAGDNYQALRAIEKLYNDAGKTFIMPFTPDKTIKEIDSFSDIVLTAIKKDLCRDETEMSHSNSNRFLLMDGTDGHADDPMIRECIRDLDGLASTIVPAKITVYKRLEDARKLAYNNSNMDLYDQITSFISRNENELRTPEEIQESIYSQAETLIARASV